MTTKKTETVTRYKIEAKEKLKSQGLILQNVKTAIQREDTTNTKEQIKITFTLLVHHRTTEHNIAHSLSKPSHL